MTTLSSAVIAAGARAGTIQKYYETVDELLDSTDSIADNEKVVAAGFLYEGAGAGATDHNLTTAGGSKLYVLPDEAGSVNVQAFGAKGDGVTDDTVAFNAAFKARTFDAIRDEYASTYRVTIPPTDDFYLITSDLVIQRNIIIEGTAPHARGVTGTRIKFSDACTAGFWFQAPGGDSALSVEYETAIGANAYGAGRSVMRDLILQPVNNGMVDFGVIHNSTMVMERVLCRYFKLANFFAHAQSSGNATYGSPDGLNGQGTMAGNVNLSEYHNCVALSATDGHGFVARGNNAGTVHYFNCDASLNKGCGFRLDTPIGCYLTACHTSRNSIIVLHNTKKYICIKGHTSSAAGTGTGTNEPGVGDDWREYWIEISTSITHDTTWVTATAYKDCGGVNCTDTAGDHAIILHYTEGADEFGVIPRGSTLVLGGSAMAGRTYKGPDSVGVFILGVPLTNTPPDWKYADPTYPTSGYVAGSALGANLNTLTLFQGGHSVDSENGDTTFKELKLAVSTVRKTYEWQKGSTPLVSITMPGWSQNLYSGSSNLYLPQGVIVGGHRAVRLRGAFSAETSGPTGTVVKGDTYLYENSGNGTYGMGRVTTGGIIGSTAVLRGMALIE